MTHTTDPPHLGPDPLRLNRPNESATVETTLGVIGGGQLGKMFVHAAQTMGFDTIVLDPDPHSLAGLVAHSQIVAAYDDASALHELAKRTKAITTEFENVPSASLELLATLCEVSPSASAVSIAQDRIKEKAFFTRCASISGVAPAPYAVLKHHSQISAIDPALLPGILKTARMGYDGKGQVQVQTLQQLIHAYDCLAGAPYVLERRLSLSGECSVILARSRSGCIVNLPVQKNLHRGGILAVTQVYGDVVAQHTIDLAIETAKTIAQSLEYVGVMCVEFFILQDDSLVVNEIAPRPHNSGHYSVDACDVSQFDLQVRTLANLPLVQPRQHSAAVMLNLMGELWLQQSHFGQQRQPPWDQILRIPGLHLHLYGKRDARPGRKMGHITLTAPNGQQALDRAIEAARLLGIEPF